MPVLAPALPCQKFEKSAESLPRNPTYYSAPVAADRVGNVEWGYPKLDSYPPSLPRTAMTWRIPIHERASMLAHVLGSVAGLIQKL